VRIEIRRNGATVSVMWPTSSMLDSAAWFREITQ